MLIQPLKHTEEDLPAGSGTALSTEGVARPLYSYAEMIAWARKNTEFEGAIRRFICDKELERTNPQLLAELDALHKEAQHTVMNIINKAPSTQIDNHDGGLAYL